MRIIKDTKIQFMSQNKLGALLSGTVIILGIISLILAGGPLLSIDFKGGTLIELRSSDSKINVSSLRDKFSQMNLGDISVKKFGNDKDYLIKFENKDNKKNVIEEIKINLDKSFGNNFNFRRVENVGPKVSEELLKSGVIDQESLDGARIERYVIGPVFNLNFFYSPLEEDLPKLELLGVDWRFESSLDGHVRLPAPQQMTLPQHQMIPEMTVVGHNTATIRESLLENAFALGEKFVEASKQHYDPGVIGPFCLQTCIDKDMNYSIYDVAPRLGGGTNVHLNMGHPYGNATWRKPVSSGRRIAIELRRAVEQDRLLEVLT